MTPWDWYIYNVPFPVSEPYGIMGHNWTGTQTEGDGKPASLAPSSVCENGVRVKTGTDGVSLLAVSVHA